MARIIGDDTGDGKGKLPKGHRPRQPKAKHPKGHKGHGHGHKGHQPKHPRAPHPGSFHEQAGAGSAGHAGGSSAIRAGHPSPQAGSGLLARELSVPLGLSSVILDLVGEGQLSVNSALGAWQREQDRITNRAWRRPGGLARIGKL
jgi:hypothetical protein